MEQQEYFKNEFSKEIWEQTYKHHTDNDVSDTWRRVANNIASIEQNNTEWENKFYSILENFKFVPGGRILSNAGTEWKASYINCFVKPRSNIEDIDSLDGIMRVLKDQAQTLKSEGGWGCNFSFIRPRGSFIYGIGVETPGSVKYMEIFDKSSEIITSGSGKKSLNKKSKGKIRKGAMMGVLDCWHPDIVEFITAKQTEGRLTKFNISVGCYNDFMDKVLKIEELQDNGESIPDELDSWDLIFPDTTHEKYKTEWFGDIYDWKSKNYPVVKYDTVKVSYLWNLIMESTYNRNDPGVLFLDIANKTHCWNYGPRRISRILETNPCGEQALPDAGCCNLGSLNLTQFVDIQNKTFNIEDLKNTVRIAVRFLDNVNSISYSPLEEYKSSMEKLRRIGLGVMGWGSALFLFKVRYGSPESLKIQEELMQTITYTAIDESINLAIEKGAFEFCDKEKHSNHEYFKSINLPQDILDKMAKYGIRNSSLFSIQPTGNTGIVANNVSGGLEPIFMHEYIRTTICPHVPEHIKPYCPKYWEGEFVETDMFKLHKEGTDDILIGTDLYGVVYKIDRNRGLTVETLCEDYSVNILKSLGEWEPSSEWAATTTQLSVEDHVAEMTGFAKYIDSAISKTVNLPNDYSYDNFKKVYTNCYKTGVIKGFTTYRAGTMTSVLKSTSDSKIIELKTTMAPKRPKTLPVEVHCITAKGEKYIVAVGLLDSQPYELFGGHANGFNIKKSTTGEITKIKRGQYSLTIGELEISDFSKHFTPQEQTIFRMASTMMRHGIPTEFIVEQMIKSSDDMFSLPSAIARVLKKYIKDGQQVIGVACPECEQETIVYSEGCKVCKNCGYSACS
jgi:ribonucleoside-diphosphate reductase alpha chain